MDKHAANKAMPATVLADYWLDWWRHANALGRASFEWISVSTDPRSFRDRWLAALGQTVDQYMRSPAFLEAMQYNLKALTSPTSLALYRRLT